MDKPTASAEQSREGLAGSIRRAEGQWEAGEGRVRQAGPVLPETAGGGGAGSLPFLALPGALLSLFYCCRSISLEVNSTMKASSSPVNDSSKRITTPEEAAAAAASLSRSSGLRAELGRREPRAGGGGRADVDGWGGEVDSEAARHTAPLREALPVAPSRRDTKGGVAAAASLRRSRSPESPRLRRRRRRLRLLLSLRLFPTLSVSGQWSSAGGGGAMGDAVRLRACALAAPPGPAPRSGAC